MRLLFTSCRHVAHLMRRAGSAFITTIGQHRVTMALYAAALSAPTASSSCCSLRFAVTPAAPQAKHRTSTVRSIGRVTAPKGVERKASPAHVRKPGGTTSAGSQRGSVRTSSPTPSLPSDKLMQGNNKKKSIARVTKRISETTQGKKHQHTETEPQTLTHAPETTAVATPRNPLPNALPTYVSGATEKPEGYAKSLACKFPFLAEEYLLRNPVPADVIPHETPVPVEWQCRMCGHVWSQSVFSRTIVGGGCPSCVALLNPTLSRISPKLALELHPTRNDPFVTAETLTNDHRQPLWWRCSDCQHEFVSTLRRRVSGTSADRACPNCSGQSRGEMFKYLSLEWHPTKNGDLLPEVAIRKETPGKKRLLWWLCPSCAFEWQSPAGPRLRGFGACPKCHPKRSQISNIPKHAKCAIDGVDPSQADDETDGSSLGVNAK